MMSARRRASIPHILAVTAAGWLVAVWIGASAGQVAEPVEQELGATLPLPLAFERSGATRQPATAPSLPLRRSLERGLPEDTQPGRLAEPWKVGALLGALLLVVVTACRWGVRRRRRTDDLFHELGRFPLMGRQAAHLVRFGNKILVLAPNGNGIEKLTELDDPREVARVTQLCLGAPDHEVIEALNDALTRPMDDRSRRSM